MHEEYIYVDGDMETDTSINADIKNKIEAEDKELNDNEITTEVESAEQWQSVSGLVGNSSSSIQVRQICIIILTAVTSFLSMLHR